MVVLAFGELVWRGLDVRSRPDRLQQRIGDLRPRLLSAAIVRPIPRLPAPHTEGTLAYLRSTGASVVRWSGALNLLMAGNPQVRTIPFPETIDRRLYRMVHGLPHSPVGDRYVSILSDLGEGLGWVAAGFAVAWMGGRKGRRAGLATAVASLATTYVVQQKIKPVFKRRRPHVGRDVTVVGIKTSDASFPSGHTASSFAAATALSTFYPKASPLVFGLAAGVGVSRVHLGHHFPSDVAVGSLIGIAAGTLVAALFRIPR